jgi:hypothetical protein
MRLIYLTIKGPARFQEGPTRNHFEGSDWNSLATAKLIQAVHAHLYPRSVAIICASTLAIWPDALPRNMTLIYKSKGKGVELETEDGDGRTLLS